MSMDAHRIGGGIRVERRRICGLLSSAAMLAALVATMPLLSPSHALGDAPISQPNIILILSDDQSYESIYKMPYLRSRIPPEGGWDRFDDAYINNATCCPSRATILTGLWSHHHGIEQTAGAPPYDDSDTIATRLHAAGYRTGFVGKYHLGSTNVARGPTYVPPGWDDWQALSPTTKGWYYNYTLNQNGTLVDYGNTPADYSTDVLRDKALSFIDRNDGEPFFLIYAPRAPHNSWIAAPRDLGHYQSEPVVHTPNFNEADMSDKPAWWSSLVPRKLTDIDGARRKEWDTTLALDDAVEAINQRIESLGLMSQTVTFFMTDNGYSFGEHRYQGKVCAYEECSHTPLLVNYGGRAQGLTSSRLIGNEDLAPTFADLAGTSPPDPSDGQSFASLLDDGTTPPNWDNEILLRGRLTGDNDGDKQGHPPSFWGLRTPRYKYIETVGTGEVELYHLSTDPYELQNLAAAPQYENTRTQLADHLWELARRGTSSVGMASVDAGGNLTYEASPGAQNETSVKPSGAYWLLTDPGAPILPGAGCEQLAVNTVRCPKAGVSRLVDKGNDGNDSIDTPNSIDASVDGGPGNDILTTESGSDGLHGGDGGDVFVGGPEPDVFDGGEGRDTVSYARRGAQPVEVDIDGALGDDGGAVDGPVGARDSINANVENVIGGGAPDVIIGSDNSNTLTGGGGADQLRGLAGNDTILANGDGSSDEINCGAGLSDVVFADSIDVFETTGPDACEIVK
jgi:N-acetylglucosamine-6-sulfatase